jgi:hypothetical protein
MAGGRIGSLTRLETRIHSDVWKANQGKLHNPNPDGLNLVKY